MATAMYCVQTKILSMAPDCGISTGQKKPHKSDSSYSPKHFYFIGNKLKHFNHFNNADVPL